MIEVYTNQIFSGKLFQDSSNFIFEYQDYSSAISMIMPPTKKLYYRKHFLHPFFEMFLPEGYLYELLKQILTKEYGTINDYQIFEYLAPNIEARVTFKTDKAKTEFKDLPSLEEILARDSQDSFFGLLRKFMVKNAIGGIHPKTIVPITGKAKTEVREYIVKTWGEEFPCLSENEYFSMKAAQRAGIIIPEIQLSENKTFLVVKKFNVDEKNNYYGFEEILGLTGKNISEKYNGSYENVSKIVFNATGGDDLSMLQLYKIIVLNFIIKNGDAHLRNFGVLYDKEMKNIRLSPAYDIVTTVAYLFKDKPALTMDGRKVWLGINELKKYGQKFCFLTEKNCNDIIEECKSAVFDTACQLQDYIRDNNKFAPIGKRMIDIWLYSLNQKDTIKELPDDIIRAW
mgnify:CR=1 FL=1